MRRSVSITLLVTLALLAVACGGDDDPAIRSPAGSASPTDGPADEPTPEPGDECIDFSGQESSLSMGDNFFEPACLTIEASQDMLLSNDGSAAHTFTIAQSTVDVELDPGQAKSLPGPFALDPGVYTFYCRFHSSPAGGGMSGTVTVV